MTNERTVLRFGVFDLDPVAGELRKAGRRVPLPPQPLKMLTLLVSRPGELVTREELRRELWGDESVVDFERGLNFCVSQVRRAIGDQASSPRFIETIPKRGYRFLAPVEPQAPLDPSSDGAVARPPGSGRSVKWPGRLGWLALPLVLGVAIGWMALRPSEPPTPGRSETRVAVLPFEDLSGEATPEYFARGLTDELITRLGSALPPSVGVIARTSSSSFRNTDRTVAEIAAALHVDWIVEGSVRRQDERIRISVRLVRAGDQAGVWSQSYERTPRDLLSVQTEVAHKVAQAIRPELAATTPPSGGRGNADALDEYLRGADLLASGGREGLPTALDHFRRALERDPELAEAHSAMGETYLALHHATGLNAREAYPAARDAARRALELDPQLASAFVTLGAVSLWYEWDLPAARASIERALSLNPSSAAAHHDYGWVLLVSAETDRGLAELRRAEALDPLAPRAILDVGWALLRARRYDDAVEAGRKAMAIDPDNTSAQFCMERALVLAARWEEAYVTIRARLVRDGTPTEQLAELDTLSAADACRALLAESLEARLAGGRDAVTSPYSVAVLCALQDQDDEALDWLEIALEKRTGSMAAVHLDPAFDDLQGNARFRRIMEAVGIAPAP